MTLRTLFKSLAFVTILSLGTLTTGTVFGGMFSIANISLPSGTTPNGTSWASLSSGTSPVAYLNLSTGELQIDPKGKSISSFSFKYGASTVSGTTNGPFTYSQTGANAVGVVFPAGSYTFPPTTDKAQLGAAFYSLTSGTSSTNASSGNTFFDVPWSFGIVAPTATGGTPWTAALVDSSTSGEGFRSSTSGLTAGFTANYLGYGNGVGLFDYTVNGVSGKGLGAIIPVQAVPEPSTIVLAGLGAAAVGITQIRRRRKQASVATIAA
ncbi:MAG: PEP-CTERM sorting domain-containing protein [Planctomycetota bacterium]